MKRRQFLGSTLAALIASPTRGAEGKVPHILLRNGWQSINIGDIAHQMGMLELLETHLPEVKISFWASKLDHGVEELVMSRFPKVHLVKGPQAIARAFQDCDFFLHGSGSGFVAQNDVARWRAETKKPYGVFGISFFENNAEGVKILNDAEFVYFRDSASLGVAKAQGCNCPIMEFGPDCAFGVVKLRNDRAADAFLAAHQLEPGKFLCCIPRYRWTPHWKIDPKRAIDPAKQAHNERMQDHDHAQLREGIIRITRQTDMKVLICCEDMTQIQLGRQMIYEMLPDDVREKVVWRDKYWLTDEALSTYVKSAGLFGNEMHSPIMCIANGIPALVCRFKEQTSKGIMWRDIGLDSWLFDLDDAEDCKRIAPTILALAKDPAAAKAKAAAAREFVRGRQVDEMKTLGNHLRQPANS
jgi:polysaccharide pyruvyl transferase WcaK-like protein